MLGSKRQESSFITKPKTVNGWMILEQMLQKPSILFTGCKNVRWNCYGFENVYRN